MGLTLSCSEGRALSHKRRRTSEVCRRAATDREAPERSPCARGKESVAAAASALLVWLPWGRCLGRNARVLDDRLRHLGGDPAENNLAIAPKCP